LLVVYCVPVSVTSQLNVVRDPVFVAAVSVRVAWIDVPAFRIVFCRFQFRVSVVVALVGFQLFVVMVSVSGMLPVFLMYIVCVAVLPGLRVPTVRVVAGCVQALSVYTPRFTAFMVPFRGTVWVLRSAAVVTVRNSPAIARAITAALGIFWYSIVHPQLMSQVLSINKS